MPKTGLKTFVYSFSVSLFAIFAANGIYWHNRPSTASEIKIPQKNVMLFLKAEPLSPSNLSAPVKKIALSVLPEVRAGQPPAENADIEDEIIMADVLSDMPEIPLELEAEFASPPEPVMRVAAAEPVVKSRISELKPRPTPSEAKSRPEPEKISIPLQIPKAADISPAQQNIRKPALLAEQAVKPKPVLKIAAAEPVPLLPLERSYDALAQSTTKVKISTPQELNHVALADKNIPIRSMEEAAAAVKAPTAEAAPQWESMADKNISADSPWLAARAGGAPKNSKIAEETFYKKENAAVQQALMPGQKAGSGVQVASETVKNLLIPIPEDILNDENLTPQLSFSPQNKPTAEKDEQTPIPAAEEAIPTDPEVQKNKLLSSLNAIFSADTKVKQAEKKKTPEKEGILSKLHKTARKSSAGKIMPTEMRLSFQPNRAEISGQTLRWIQAFAAKAAEDKSMSIEIRIDGTSAMDLQQKRLNLLHNILTNKGVEYSKINTVFTQREPNSFIIKTIVHNSLNQRGSNGNLNKNSFERYQQW